MKSIQKIHIVRSVAETAATCPAAFFRKDAFYAMIFKNCLNSALAQPSYLAFFLSAQGCCVQGQTMFRRKTSDVQHDCQLAFASELFLLFVLVKTLFKICHDKPPQVEREGARPRKLPQERPRRRPSPCSRR